MRRRAGFSLLELVFALGVGALLVAVAASLARFGARQTGRGDEQNNLSQRVRLLRSQIRADIEAAGIGSTGAIAIPTAPAAFWNALAVTTPIAGYRAMPAIRGANNITGDADAAPGSDAVQIVVPDPSTLARTTLVSGPPTDTELYLPLPLPAGIASCPNGLVYIVDHSAPNGAGRAHLLTLDLGGAAASPGIASTIVPTSLGATILFPIAAGSDVMCARISTYWVSADPADPNRRHLRRDDLVPGATAPSQLGGSNLYISNRTLGNDLISPGVLDLQIAYSFSSEFPGIARTGNDADRWAFDNVAGAGVDGAVELSSSGADFGWFETRLVRVNMLVRTLRRVEDQGSYAIAPLPLEDRTPGTEPRVEVHYGRQVVTTQALLTNLRYFDYTGSIGLVAEPY
jgi:type II secretory pathway pseudopilin PulG